MSAIPDSSSNSIPETGSELGGSIWKAFRAQQLQALAWWEKYTQQNAEATARDAWREGAGQPNVTAGLFSRTAKSGSAEDGINVDSPITHHHYPPPDTTWKTIATIGGLALAGMGVWQAPAIIGALTAPTPSAPQNPPTHSTEVIEHYYQIGEITVQ